MARPMVRADVLDKLVRQRRIVDRNAGCAVRLKSVNDLQEFENWLYTVNEDWY